jgi:hypothetical protein
MDSLASYLGFLHIHVVPIITPYISAIPIFQVSTLTIASTYSATSSKILKYKKPTLSAGGEHRGIYALARQKP